MTDAELTILSLVAEGPRYGYEIQQIIDDRGLRDWMTIGFSSIYYILNKLERQNMLASTLRPDSRGPARKVYEITEAGRGVLQTAIASLLRQPRQLGSGFELGLANLHAIKPRQVYRVLSHHHDDLKDQLESVEKAWARHQQEDAAQIPSHLHALYTHSIAMMKAEMAWMESFLEHWRQRYPGVTEVEATESKEIDIHNAKTQLSRLPPPEPAKMLQRLKRPKPPETE